MGWKARTYKLDFEDPALEGLEVRARGASIDEVARMTYLVDLGHELLAADRSTERDEFYDTLAGGLLDWNLEDDADQPVPLTLATLRAQEWSLVIPVARAWLTAQMGVPAPLEPSSNGGGPSPELSLPMEVLSPNPGS